MKKLIVPFVLSLVFVAEAFAGTMFIRANVDSAKVFKTNLSNVGSLTFVEEGKDNASKLNVKKSETSEFLYTEFVKKLHSLSFSYVQPNIAETMSVRWRNAKGESFSYTAFLAKIENIEIINIPDSLDSDEDGLSDYEELYVYETNPHDADTDGDGYDDKEEVGRFKPENPTLWNPKVADLPRYKIELIQLPDIYLSLKSSSGETVTKTIVEGRNDATANSVNQSYASSGSLKNGWAINFGAAGGRKPEKDSTSPGSRFVDSAYVLTWGGSISPSFSWNGNSSLSQGTTIGASLQKTMGETYTKTVAESNTNGTEIEGAKIRTMLRFINTGHVAYTIENVAAMLSSYRVNGTLAGKIQRLVDVKEEVKASLNPGDTIEIQAADMTAPRGVVEPFIANPGALFITSANANLSTVKEGGIGNIETSDFNDVFTSAYAKTAVITFDYGPSATELETVKEYRVATQFRQNTESVSLNDVHQKTTLNDIFDILGVDYKEGSLTVEGKEWYGLISIGDYKYDESKEAMWYISVIKAGNHDPDIRTIKSHDFSLKNIEVNSGDSVFVFYSEDKDRDGLSAHEEALLGTDDTKTDTDGDGISDYDEVYGWDPDCASCRTYKTNPLLADSDYDGLPDNEDSDPIHRELGTNAHPHTVTINGKNAEASYDHLYHDQANYVTWSNREALPHSSETDVAITTWQLPGDIIVMRKDDRGEYKKLEYTKEENENTYKIKIKDLKIGDDTIRVDILSEDMKDTVINFIAINGNLESVGAPTLGSTENKDGIIVNFAPIKDDRVLGYIVVADSGSYDWSLTSLSSIKQLQPTESLYKKGEQIRDAYGSYVVEVLDTNKNSFTDMVGGGSPYWTYRVFAYAKQGDKYVYSESQGWNRRSVGRISMKYQLVSVGTESCSEYSVLAFTLYWYSMRVRAQIFADNPEIPLKHYNYWFYAAGSRAHPYTVIWETNADNEDDLHDFWGRHNCDCVGVDRNEYEAEIGKKGVRLKFFNEATVPEREWKKNTDAAVTWTYEDIVKIMNDESKNGKEFTFTWGAEGNVAYNDCGDGSCGTDPRAGYKFKFTFKYVDAN